MEFKSLCARFFYTASIFFQIQTEAHQVNNFYATDVIYCTQSHVRFLFFQVETLHPFNAGTQNHQSFGPPPFQNPGCTPEHSMKIGPGNESDGHGKVMVIDGYTRVGTQ